MKAMLNQIRQAVTAANEDRVRYLVLLLGNIGCVPQLLGWGGFMHYHGAIELAYIFYTWTLLTIIFFIALLARPSLFEIIAFTTLFLTILNNLLISIELGGLTNSGGQFMWGFVSPMGALLLYGVRRALFWFVGYLISVVVLLLAGIIWKLEPKLGLQAQSVQIALNALFIGTLIFQSFCYVFLKMTHFMALLKIEEEKSERLLLNILPKEIAGSLKQGEETVAQSHAESTILFLDLVGFTELAAHKTAAETVSMLNAIYCRFDELTEAARLEKIKTIGDCYMVASGVPNARADHAIAAVRLALALQQALADCLENELHLPTMHCRVGLHSGAITSGVIGKRKFAFDVWGDTVNTASRMESHGIPGRIQISHATYLLVKEHFDCEDRGTIAIKGKGDVQTWFVLRAKA